MNVPEWPESTPEERAALFDAHALSDPSSIGAIVRVIQAHTDRLLAEARAAAWEEGHSNRGHSQLMIDDSDAGDSQAAVRLGEVIGWDRVAELARQSRESERRMAARRRSLGRAAGASE